MELVRRVTGHATVEVVLKHYFRPDREQFRAALTDALPDVLTGGKANDVKPQSEMAQVLDETLGKLGLVKSKSKDFAAAVKLVRKAKELATAV